MLVLCEKIKRDIILISEKGMRKYNVNISSLLWKLLLHYVALIGVITMVTMTMTTLLLAKMKVMGI